MQLPYYMAYITPEVLSSRYEMLTLRALCKPCNKAIAFHISMIAPKYALDPYNCTRCSLKSLFENDREKNFTDKYDSKSELISFADTW